METSSHHVIRVLLVDDEPPALERLSRLLAGHPDVRCVGEARNGLEALTAIDALRPDLVILDIQMPELDGLAVAEAIPRDGPAVVFATAFDHHAVKAFELAAVDYLLKPVSRERLAAALARARERKLPAAELARSVLAGMPDANVRSRKMTIRDGSSYVVFDETHIAAVVARDRYATVYVDGRELLSEQSLDRWTERLDGARFLRVHRSAIVNFDFLRELRHEGDRKYVAILDGVADVRVPISREKLDTIKRRLGIDAP